jgi:hypothetical protein
LRAQTQKKKEKKSWPRHKIGPEINAGWRRHFLGILCGGPVTVQMLEANERNVCDLRFASQHSLDSGRYAPISSLHCVAFYLSSAGAYAHILDDWPDKEKDKEK